MTLAELVKILEQNYTLVLAQENMTYEDEYELLFVEHQKHHSLSGETPNYSIILQNAVILLQKGSGHFLILVSLCNAMAQVYQWQGLIQSIRFLDKMLTTHWNALYPAPERLKGRVQMLEWLIKRWEKYFEAHPVNILTLDLANQILNTFKPLNDMVYEKFNNELSLFSLIRPLEDHVKKLNLEQSSRAARQKTEEERLKREAAEAELRQQQNIMQILENNAESLTSQDYLANMDSQSLFELARARRFKDNLILMQDQPLDLSLYLFSRINTWFAYPYSWTEVANMIAAYVFDDTAHFAALKLFYMQKYEEALIAYEALFHRFPYYLDYQYYILECIEGIDKNAALLKHALINLVQQLASLYPDLEKTMLPNDFKVCSNDVMRRFEIFTQPTEYDAPTN